ncbi:MAG: 2-hydroxyacid dehydrogenase, partial [SAR324 cluster bacterium]|nr:2-hydroxyacid dehydrogenase [SAR324 cluster bacterium]
RYEVHRLWEACDQEALISEVAPQIRVVVTEGWAPADFQAKFPNLELIASFGVGYDGVDIEAAQARKITVTNTPGVLDDAVADITIGLLIAVTRGIVVGDQYVRNGEWLKANFPLMSHLRGRQAGILGLGRIGLAIAQRLQAFGIEINYHNRRERSDVDYKYYSSLSMMAQDIDFLILSCVGGEETKKIVNREIMEKIGPNGVLINISRGSVVDEGDLVACLEEVKLGGAGLDVFTSEPHVPEALFKMPQVVLQPHIGSATLQTRIAMGQLVVDNVDAYYAKKPLLTPVA